MKENIIKITKLKNVKIQNTHDDYLFPYQDVIIVEYANKKERTIDLIANKDITDIDYYKVVKTDRTKESIIFEEYKEDYDE